MCKRQHSHRPIPIRGVGHNESPTPMSIFFHENMDGGVGVPLYKKGRRDRGLVLSSHNKNGGTTEERKKLGKGSPV